MIRVSPGLKIVIGLLGAMVTTDLQLVSVIHSTSKNSSSAKNAFLPFNRNGVLFPQKIDGKYAMLSRPSDNGHTPFGDIYISYSPDMKYWGNTVV